MPWGGIFDYDNKIAEIEEEEGLTTQPGFWDDPKEGEKTMKAIKSKKIWTGSFEKLNTAYEDLETLYEFYS